MGRYVWGCIVIFRDEFVQVGGDGIRVPVAVIRVLEGVKAVEEVGVKAVQVFFWTGGVLSWLAWRGLNIMLV